MEQFRHRVNEREKIIEELDSQLKEIHLDLQLNSKDQTQLVTESDSQMCRDVRNVKLIWRKGKPAPEKM